MGRRFHAVARLDCVAETVLALASRTDVYVGVVPRRRRGGGRADLVGTAGVLWVDCDTSGSVAALRGFSPAPGMVVSSGSGHNCHAYWLLDEPAELDVVERINRGLALRLGADIRCSDPARILRLLSVGRAARVGVLPACSFADASVTDVEACDE
jgi:hypothetical protein